MNTLELSIKAEIARQSKVLERCRKSRFKLKQYDDYILMKCIDSKHSTTRYYCRNLNESLSTRHYCGKNQFAKIRGIKHLHFIDETISRTESNIKILKSLSAKLQSIQSEDINSKLPKAYRCDESIGYLFFDNADSEAWRHKWLTEKEEYTKQHGQYKPEQLRHKAIDGTLCRSIGEVSIYNYLLQSGFTFIYEPVMWINHKLCLPDFLILCDDGTEIIIEHLGMTNNHNYLIRQDEKIENYIRGGWIPNVNLFLTFDDYYGNINMEAIAWLISSRVKKG